MNSIKTRRMFETVRSRFAILALLAAGAQACALSSEAELGAGSDDLTASATSTDGTLACNGATSVQVSISGTNLTSVTPLDLMLVIDESGSIASSEFAQLKTSLQSLVNGLDELFANGGKVGVVSFDTSARLIISPSNSKQSVLDAIANMVQHRGATCIGCGIQLALGQLASYSAADRSQAMIVLTDGYNNPSSTLSVFNSSLSGAHNMGITLFAVGVGSSYSLSELQQIGTGDGDSNVFTTGSFDGLTSTFQSLVAAIVTPEATDAELVLDVNTAFDIQTVSASAGSAIIEANRIRWTIPKIQDETVTLSYEVAHDPGLGGGGKAMHTAVAYSDAEQNALSLNELSVDIFGCDTDHDGVVDEEDSCSGTPEGAIANGEGCSIGQLCPCSEPGARHGKYASCVAHETKSFAQAGLLTNQQKAQLESSAAKGACID